MRPESMEFNFESKRMQTYQEELAERVREIDYDKNVKKEMDRIVVANGKDVFRSQYLVNLADDKTRDAYKKLRDKEIEHDVHKTLIEYHHENKKEGIPAYQPALMGERYMQEKMTDTQFREAIDRTIELKEQYLKGNKYLKNKDKYDDEPAVKEDIREIEEKVSKLFDDNVKLLNERRKNAGMKEYLPGDKTIVVVKP